jgi:hypothetical protein
MPGRCWKSLVPPAGREVQASVTMNGVSSFLGTVTVRGLLMMVWVFWNESRSSVACLISSFPDQLAGICSSK